MEQNEEFSFFGREIRNAVEEGGEEEEEIICTLRFMVISGAGQKPRFFFHSESLLC